jgi:hypothetical protein
MRQLVLHVAVANLECRSELLIRLSPGGQAQDVELAFGERIGLALA